MLHSPSVTGRSNGAAKQDILWSWSPNPTSNRFQPGRFALLCEPQASPPRRDTGAIKKTSKKSQEGLRHAPDGGRSHAIARPSPSLTARSSLREPYLIVNRILHRFSLSAMRVRRERRPFEPSRRHVHRQSRARRRCKARSGRHGQWLRIHACRPGARRSISTKVQPNDQLKLSLIKGEVMVYADMTSH